MTLRGNAVAPRTAGNPVLKIYQIAWVGLDWLYPPLCGGCQEPGSRWCETCQALTERIPDTVCQFCGLVLLNNGICSQCDQLRPPYQALRAWAKYSDRIRSAIHRLKYAGDIALAEILARPLIQLVHTQAWQIDIVTAVPLGVSRMKQRGFNQSALLAFPLALGIRKPFRSKAISRVRETKSQVGLSSTEREENVRGAFKARKEIVARKRVLLVDDVITTGSTMTACTNALLQAGALEVYCIALARPNITEVTN